MKGGTKIMADKNNSYVLRYRDKKQADDFEKICRTSKIDIADMLRRLVDECIANKRRVGLMP